MVIADYYSLVADLLHYISLLILMTLGAATNVCLADSMYVFAGKFPK